MIGQLPPYALATPAFRFRALASHAGRATLGGDREIALACFSVARLAAGLLPPVMLAPGDAVTRANATRQWLASLTMPASSRAAAAATIDAISRGSRRGAAESLMVLRSVAGPQLDSPSIAEIDDLANALQGATGFL